MNNQHTHQSHNLLAGLGIQVLVGSHVLATFLEGHATNEGSVFDRS